MIYKDIQLYTPNLKINKQNYLVIDLEILDRQCFKNMYNIIAEQIKSSADLIQNRFMDTIISLEDLNLKVKAVILNFASFSQQFKPVDQQGEYPAGCTRFEYLRKKYQTYLTIGFKINLQKPEQFEKLKQLNLIKKITLFSFTLSQNRLDEDFPKMRKYVNQLFSPTKKIHFHLKIHLQSTQALKKIKRQFIQYQYPIEYFAFETNLINFIENRFKLNISSHWEQIGFKYLRAIQKYIPAAFGAVLQCYESQQSSKIDIKSILYCLNFINCRNYEQLKQRKRFHNTGLGIIQPIFYKLLKDYTPDQYGHYRTKSDWSLILSKIQDAVLGKLKFQQNQYQQIFQIEDFKDE